MERTMLTLTNETQQTGAPLPPHTRPVLRWRRPGDEHGAMVIDTVDAAGRTLERGIMVSFTVGDDEAPAGDELIEARRHDAKEAAATLPRD